MYMIIIALKDNVKKLPIAAPIRPHPFKLRVYIYIYIYIYIYMYIYNDSRQKRDTVPAICKFLKIILHEVYWWTQPQFLETVPQLQHCKHRNRIQFEI